MRPDPREQSDHEQSGRIIYLGDVRRRKVSRRQAPDSDYLVAMALAATASWAVWAVVLFNIAPSKLLTYLVFFIPLACAVTATGALIASAFERRRQTFLSLRTAVRRGAMLAAMTVFNLSCLAAHRWTILVLATSVVVATGVDLAASHRNR